MLNVTVPYPHAGCIAYMDDVDPEGNDVVEKVRIIAHKPEDLVLIAIQSHRYPGQVASGNRTVELSALRETEATAPVEVAALPLSKPSGRAKGRRR